jgi:hypothetical protein
MILGRLLLLLLLLAVLLQMMLAHTSAGGRLGNRAVRLTFLLDRLVEQDEVLLLGRQPQVLEVLLLRGLCRQAW